ncbi:MAG TPA: WS/DGAT domain-containing protein [Dermatophilaceae bacterium]|nr:WS/DGAT domain-containing protein [Dermatophilaceae bacterium]
MSPFSSVDREPVRAAAHRLGGTTNDAVLAGYGRALGRLLTTRGESLDEIVMTVPVSGRRRASGQQQASGEGNLVAPAIVAVPTSGDPARRVAAVAAAVRARKEAATGPPPIAVLGPAFRVLAAVGGCQWYMARQQRMHTLLTHVRAPSNRLSLGGHPITETVAVPVGGGGNTSVYAAVVSYGGRLTITLVVDPDLVGQDELTRLADDPRADLAAIVAAARPAP